MTAPLPDPKQVLDAIDAYLDIAYEAEPPESVAERVDPLRAAHHGTRPEAFFQQASFVRSHADAGPRFSLRLGNARYPFMKLTVEPRPDAGGYLYKADTHDRHICPPPDSPEHAAFAELMRFNEGLAASIEDRWAARGIPTFKSWLRADLARRTREHGSN